MNSVGYEIHFTTYPCSTQKFMLTSQGISHNYSAGLLGGGTTVFLSFYGI